MKPTTKLRFVRRVIKDGYLIMGPDGRAIPHGPKEATILQQWFEGESAWTGDIRDIRPGEWRDVPVENE